MSSQAMLPDQQGLAAPRPSPASPSPSSLAPDTPSTPHYWQWWHTLSMLLFSAGIITIGPLLPAEKRLLIWLSYLVLLYAFILVLGKGTTGKWRGAFIDERNKISLSRLQSVLWTIVVLSAFLAAAITNIRMVGSLLGLQIALPEQLWLLMGISVTSLIGTPLIHNYKKDNDLPATQPINTPKVENKGILIVNKNSDAAQWQDMFRGEEVGNKDSLDLGKVQMFCFTVLLVFAYAVALGALFNGSQHAISTFPAFDDSVIALLAISHIGYLANKAIPHTT